MAHLENTFIFGALWAVVLITDLSLSKKGVAGGFASALVRVLRSFWASVVVHLTLFSLFFCSLTLLSSDMGVFDTGGLFLFWMAGGISAVPSIVLLVRMRTDEVYLVRQWIEDGLENSTDKDEYLRSLLAHMDSKDAPYQGKKILMVLRELALRGDSQSVSLRRALDERGLLK
jgi:hypothetical protein